MTQQEKDEESSHKVTHRVVTLDKEDERKRMDENVLDEWMERMKVDKVVSQIVEVIERDEEEEDVSVREGLKEERE